MTPKISTPQVIRVTDYGKAIDKRLAYEDFLARSPLEPNRTLSMYIRHDVFIRDGYRPPTADVSGGGGVHADAHRHIPVLNAEGAAGPIPGVIQRDGRKGE